MIYTFRISSGMTMRAIALGIILVLFSLFLLFQSEAIIAGVFILLALPLLFFRKYSKLNTDRKTIQSYFSLLGMPLGKKVKMNEIKGIKIVRAKSSRTINSRVSSTSIENTEYRAFIYFDNKKLLLSHNQDKKDLIKHMKIISEDLSINLKA